MIAEDSNARIRLGDRDEAGCLAYTRYEPRIEIDSFIARKHGLGVIESGERKGSSSGGAH